MKVVTYMDDIKIFVKKEKELETRIQMIRIYSRDIRLEFGIKKYVILTMKKEKIRNYKRNKPTY